MDDTDGLYTQMIFRNIPNEHTQFSHWHPFAFIISINALDDIQHEEKTPVKDYKREIINKMKIVEISSVSFMHSHEIVFTEKIPIDKYVLAVTLYDNVLKRGAYNEKQLKKLNKAISLIKKLNLKIILQHGVGINKLIDGIES